MVTSFIGSGVMSEENPHDKVTSETGCRSLLYLLKWISDWTMAGEIRSY